MLGCLNETFSNFGQRFSNVEEQYVKSRLAILSAERVFSTLELVAETLKRFWIMDYLIIVTVQIHGPDMNGRWEICYLRWNYL